MDDAGVGHMGRPLLTVLLGSLFLPAGAIVGRGLDAQSVPAVRLSEAEATFHYGFTHVTGIRELRDGRVIVLDSTFGTVQVIDAAWLSLDQIGRRGAGPREYISPHRLFALPGDSSAV